MDYNSPNGVATNYKYDDFNRLKKVIYPPAFSGAARLEERSFAAQSDYAEFRRATLFVYGAKPLRRCLARRADDWRN